MKYFFLLITTILLIPLIQNVNAQHLNNTGNLTSFLGGVYYNKSATQRGLIPNNPGYTMYIPNSSFLIKNAPSTTGLAPNYVGIFKNTSGLVQNNPGYGKYITNTSSGKALNYTSITPLPP